MVKYNDEIFEGNEDAAISVIWWLLSQLGGKVIVPIDEDFWRTAVPTDASLVMYKEGDQMILEAERLDQN